MSSGPNAWGQVSPLCVSIMMACYYSPEPEGIIGATTWNSAAGEDIRRWLLSKELITPTSRATPRGIAWVEGMCATPLPVSETQWRIIRS